MAGKPRTGETVPNHSAAEARDAASLVLREVPVARIRPEDGLDRKRDREGHRELQRSIEQFGVLTPITVRPAPDRSGDFLLIKGQGRTLACRLLGIETIPAVVVDEHYAETEKVQQFLVENVARLKMSPIDRALLIQRARELGEETADIAKRFGVAPATVRRLLTQLDGASSAEVASLKAGAVNLGTHAVVARYVLPQERMDALEAVARSGVKTKELDALFLALGWNALEGLGAGQRKQRLKLLEWALSVLAQLPAGSIRERLMQLALRLPLDFRGEKSERVKTVQCK